MKNEKFESGRNRRDRVVPLLPTLMMTVPSHLEEVLLRRSRYRRGPSCQSPLVLVVVIMIHRVDHLVAVNRFLILRSKELLEMLQLVDEILIRRVQLGCKLRLYFGQELLLVRDIELAFFGSEPF